MHKSIKSSNCRISAGIRDNDIVTDDRISTNCLALDDQWYGNASRVKCKLYANWESGIIYKSLAESRQYKISVATSTSLFGDPQVYIMALLWSKKDFFYFVDDKPVVR